MAARSRRALATTSRLRQSTRHSCRAAPVAVRRTSPPAFHPASARRLGTPPHPRAPGTPATRGPNLRHTIDARGLDRPPPAPELHLVGRHADVGVERMEGQLDPQLQFVARALEERQRLPLSHTIPRPGDFFRRQHDAAERRNHVEHVEGRGWPAQAIGRVKLLLLPARTGWSQSRARARRRQGLANLHRAERVHARGHHEHTAENRPHRVQVLYRVAPGDLQGRRAGRDGERRVRRGGDAAHTFRDLTNATLAGHGSRLRGTATCECSCTRRPRQLPG